MKKTMLMAAMTMLVTAGCGAPVKVGGGKAGAAAALSAASKPTKASATRAAAPIDLTDLGYDCPEGGTAKMSGFTTEVSGNDLGGTVAQRFTLTYVGCGLEKTEAGVAVYDGSFTVEQRIEGTEAGGSIVQKFTGKVTLSGAFEDFLEANVTQTIAASALGAGDASMKLVGTLRTEAGSYSYNEDLSVVGGIPVGSASTTQAP